MVKIERICLQTEWNKVTFVNMRDYILRFLKSCSFENGILVIQSVHTTCSVIFEEFTHDLDGLGYDYLQHDLVHGLNQVFPKQNLYDEYYKYPGPQHRQLSYRDYEEYRDNPAILLNADAHLKASLLGSSLTLVVENGHLLTGEFGDVYFVDWDGNRRRNRTCVLCALGDFSSVPV